MDAARTLAALVAAGILGIGLWLYLALQPKSIEDLETGAAANNLYCGRYLKTVGVVSPLRAPGFEAGDRNRQAYWLAAKTHTGGEAVIQVRFDPRHRSAPCVGQTLEIGGMARCDASGPGQAIVLSVDEHTRFPPR